ncbi:MAG TPA: type IX secretion system membrane protein PorP/SprF [Prolixibacteraceae bacterium]|nr:type IX secretion system membrane protein PorP/SprF [Prolixibacteraceae bacterium]
MKKIFCFLFLYIIANLAAIAQQDPQFTFNKMTQLTVNPGFAGSDGGVNGVILNRYQWTGIEGAPQTLLFSVGAATKLFGAQSGVGLNIISDELGFQKNIAVSVDYAYRKETGLGMLGIGASLGFYNMAINGDWETGMPEGDYWVSPTSDPNLPQGEVSQMALDLGFGVFLKADDYYVGASVTHLNQASIVFADEASTFLARHYYMSAGYNITLGDPLFEIQPSVLFKTDMVSYQADMTVDLVYNKRYSAGLNYRINDAVGVLLGFEMANGLRIGYAYDIMTSALAGYGYGSHEFYLGYSFDLGKNRNKKYKSVRYL